MFEASLRKIDSHLAEKRILSMDEPLTLFLSRSKTVVDPRNGEAFSEAIISSGTNVIFRSGILDDSKWGLLEGYSEFFDDPKKFGFVPAIPDSPVLILAD